MSKFIVAVTTVGSEEAAVTLAKYLVDERGLVACVNILPRVRSIYRWKGQIEDEVETILLMKTRRDQFVQLEAALREKHPYETPELISLPIESGSAAYFGWIDECLDQARQ